VKLFLSGKKFTAASDPASVVRVKSFLDRGKPGELLTTLQLAVALRVVRETVATYRVQCLQDYSARHGNKVYWGSRATIRQLKKELSKDAKHK
jgi:hypothetical protein